ncbi:MAG TPA: hypothetical protein VFA15_05385, partial [Nitrososphaera sp.]|nr:hypothetical protein [Nitrososphaera sp.]
MDFFKDLHKKTLDEAFQIPTTEQSLEELRQRLKSGKPLRKLGSSQEAGNLKLSEQDRQSHIHILGTTREGKSKFLEMLLTQDMGRFGATLLDPSDNGATCYSVMKWAMKKGFEKVCLIDPHDANIAIPSINPLRWRGAAACESVVQNIMESIRLLWGQTSFSDTPRIETYLKAVLAVLYMNKATLPDGVCFLVKQDGQSDRQRRKLFDNLPHYDVYRKTLEEVFNTSGQQLFLGEFKPSIRRL